MIPCVILNPIYYDDETSIYTFIYSYLYFETRYRTNTRYGLLCLTYIAQVETITAYRRKDSIKVLSNEA